MIMTVMRMLHSKTIATSRTKSMADKLGAVVVWLGICSISDIGQGIMIGSFVIICR